MDSSGDSQPWDDRLPDSPCPSMIQFGVDDTEEIQHMPSFSPPNSGPGYSPLRTSWPISLSSYGSNFTSNSSGDKEPIPFRFSKNEVIEPPSIHKRKHGMMSMFGENQQESTQSSDGEWKTTRKRRTLSSTASRKKEKMGLPPPLHPELCPVEEELQDLKDIFGKHKKHQYFPPGRWGESEESSPNWLLSESSGADEEIYHGVSSSSEGEVFRGVPERLTESEMDEQLYDTCSTTRTENELSGREEYDISMTFPPGFSLPRRTGPPSMARSRSHPERNSTAIVDLVTPPKQRKKQSKKKPSRREIDQQLLDDEAVALSIQEEDFQTLCTEGNASTQLDEQLARQFHYMENQRPRFRQPRIPAEPIRTRGLPGEWRAPRNQPFMSPVPPSFMSPFSGGLSFMSHFFGPRRNNGTPDAATRRQQAALLRMSMLNRDFTEADYEMLLALDEGITRGADRDSIEKLSKEVVQAGTSIQSCCICLCDMEEGVEIRRLPCKHYFHVECIDQWLQVNKSCPIDKKRIDEQ